MLQCSLCLLSSGCDVTWCGMRSDSSDDKKKNSSYSYKNTSRVVFYSSLLVSCPLLSTVQIHSLQLYDLKTFYLLPSQIHFRTDKSIRKQLFKDRLKILGSTLEISLTILNVNNISKTSADTMKTHTENYSNKIMFKCEKT